jgi:2-polyprenyl-3-methyl-5-hydroxy-6-metoxy-1,4-benzoquinol methylase
MLAISPEFLREINSKPIFCFTSDMDWADDEAISLSYSILDDFEVPLTPFITNRSQYIEKRFAGRMDRVGVHPNFLPGSTHGSTTAEVCQHVRLLNPEAKFYRSHGFYNTFQVAQSFKAMGYQFDSNMSLAPQADLRPLENSSGLVSYPVFFGDGLWLAGAEMSAVMPLLSTPGLKIFNFHPIHVTLNTPNADRYKKYKSSGRSWREFVHDGSGVRTRLIELLSSIKSIPSLGSVYLSDLHRMATRPSEIRSASVAVSPAPVTRTDYDLMDEEERAAYKRLEYNKRAGGGLYTTSPDLNMRELEIEFIVGAIQKFSTGTPRIVDLGCGNGYSTLRIASAVDGAVTGIDFAESLIVEAGELAKQMGVKSAPKFRVGDITTMPIPGKSFDIVVTERVLLNMTSVEGQVSMLDRIHAMLSDDGLYVMVEGNRDGLARLNKARQALGLVEIPDRGHGNVGSLKFEEDQFEKMISGKFETLVTTNFGTYFLISRIVHPMLVAPASPSFEHTINKVARSVETVLPDLFGGGHLMGRVLKKTTK